MKDTTRLEDLLERLVEQNDVIIERLTSLQEAVEENSGLFDKIDEIAGGLAPLASIASTAVAVVGAIEAFQAAVDAEICWVTKHSSAERIIDELGAIREAVENMKT